MMDDPIKAINRTSEREHVINYLKWFHAAVVRARERGENVPEDEVEEVEEEIAYILFNQYKKKDIAAPEKVSLVKIGNMSRAIWLEYMDRGEGWTQARRAQLSGMSKRHFQRSYTGLYQAGLAELDRVYLEAVRAVDLTIKEWDRQRRA